MKSLEARFKTKKRKACQKASEAPRKPARDISWHPMPWDDSGKRFEVLGDSLLILSWINGEWRCKYRLYEDRVGIARASLGNLHASHGFLPRQTATNWARHIYRELNKDADKLANKHSYHFWINRRRYAFPFYRLFFDGSVTRQGAGGGWALFSCTDTNRDLLCDWHLVAELSFGMPLTATITVCELEACIWGIVFTEALQESLDSALTNASTWKVMCTKGFPVLQLSQLIV